MSDEPSGGVPPGATPPPPPGGPGPTPANETLAMVSLGTGIGALLLGCCCGWLSPIVGIAALVTGYLALGKINQSNGQLGGKNLAIAGMICGGLGIAIGILMIVVGVGSVVIKELQRAHF